MRSIRRSLIGYFLLILGIALTALGVLIDRFANEAILAQQDAETRRIAQEFDFKSQDSATNSMMNYSLGLHNSAVSSAGTYLLLTGVISKISPSSRPCRRCFPVGMVGAGPASVTSLAAVGSPNVRGQLYFMIAMATRAEELRHSFDSISQPNSFSFMCPAGRP